MSDADLGAWSYDYDAAGNLTRQTDARNQRTCFYYDALNRLKGKTYSTGAAACPSDPGSYLVSYSYDAYDGATQFGRGRRTGMVDGSGTTSWVYDQRGRVTKETKVISGTGGGTFVTQWTYDAADRVKTMTYPGSPAETVTYTYNPQGLVETAVGRSTYVSSMTYNALGQATERWLGGVVRQRYDYTAAENFRLTGLQSGVSPNYNTLQNLSYTYDDAGNVLAITDAAAVGGSQTQTFTYDALNRLSTAQATGGSNGAYGQVSYSYSIAGNLTNFEGTAFTYQDGAHKHAVTHLGGVQKYWYDANGNASRRNNFGLDVNYAYDAENRLTGVTGGKTATFTYDGDGRLVKTQVGSVYVAIAGTHYQYSGSTATKHYYAGDVRVAERVGTTLYWLLIDHLGSTAITANASGGNVAELRYYAGACPECSRRGKPRYNVGGQKTDYRFTGQRWQNDLGMYWYNSRWYDQLTGRFLQPDTVVPQPGNPQALNRYSYVLNNSLRYTDPTGMFTEEEIMKYMGVKTWEEVLKMFEKGGKFAGEWGWLEVLRQAELGDTISLSLGDNSSMFFWDGADVTGSFYEMEGELMFLGHLGSPQTLIDLPAGLLPSMTKHTGMYQVNNGNFILAPYKTYHLSYDASKVDSTSVGLTIWSATADIGWAVAAAGVASVQPEAVIIGTLYGGGGTAASLLDLVRTYDQYQQGKASKMDLAVDLGTTAIGIFPVFGLPADMAGLAYEVRKGLYIGP